MTPEAKLSAEIKLYCGENDYVVIRQQSGIFFTRTGMQVRIGFDGLSDLLILDNCGHAYFCEVKVKPNRPTKEQIEFIEFVKSRGFAGMVVFSLSDLKKLLDYYK